SCFFFFSSRRRHTRFSRDWSSDVCSSDLLLANWRHLPVGYHGRAGTIVVSGTEIARPYGQRKTPADAAPSYGPSTRLDIEAELRSEERRVREREKRMWLVGEFTRKKNEDI